MDFFIILRKNKQKVNELVAFQNKKNQFLYPFLNFPNEKRFINKLQ